MKENFLQVGVITTTHGLKGEVKIFPTTDDPKRFDNLKKVYIEYGKERILVEIDTVKYFKKLVILKFKEFNKIDEIEKYKGCSLFIPRDQAVKLEEDEYFIAELIDMKIMDEDNQEIGILQDVLETGANDVYVIKLNDKRELLLPAIKQCILEVDSKNNTMKIHILDGLLDE
jgi:16S rRNA processing protein RimM